MKILIRLSDKLLMNILTIERIIREHLVFYYRVSIPPLFGIGYSQIKFCHTRIYKNELGLGIWFVLAKLFIRKFLLRDWVKSRRFLTISSRWEAICSIIFINSSQTLEISSFKINNARLLSMTMDTISLSLDD